VKRNALARALDIFSKGRLGTDRNSDATSAPPGETNASTLDSTRIYPNDRERGRVDFQERVACTSTSISSFISACGNLPKNNNATTGPQSRRRLFLCPA